MSESSITTSNTSTTSLHRLREPASSVGRILGSLLMLLICGALFGALNQRVRFGSFFPTSPTPSCELELEGQPLPELPPSAAALLCDKQKVIIVDVRAATLFERGHIADAIHLPCSKELLDAELRGKLLAHPTVLIYGAGDEDARVVAKSLQAQGFADLRILAGGYAAWEAQGLACASGPCDSCEESHP